MAIVRILENNTKVLQVYYDRNMDRIELKPGEKHVEAISGGLDEEEQAELSKLEADVDEMKRVKKKLSLIRISKSVEELDKLKEGEWNEEVFSAIVLRQRELSQDEVTRRR